MVRCSSLFSQLVAVFSRQQFHRLVIYHKVERYSKGFSSWDHFIAKLFCQLTQAKSLREICGRLSGCMGKLRHLGMKDAPKKSTLSYANAHRLWEIDRDLVYNTLEVCKTAAPAKYKFRFKNKLLSLVALLFPCVYHSFHGQNSAGLKGQLNYIFYWTTMAICPHVPISQMAENMTLPSLEKCH